MMGTIFCKRCKLFLLMISMLLIFTSLADSVVSLVLFRKAMSKMQMSSLEKLNGMFTLEVLV